jgi:hypothetical protein
MPAVKRKMKRRGVGAILPEPRYLSSAIFPVASYIGIHQNEAAGEKE